MGAAEIDGYGNINSTVIGDYIKPKVRLPGSGGANDIASLAKRVVIIAAHTKRKFPEKCHYITTPGYLDGPGGRERAGLRGNGPVRVVTNLAVMGFDDETKRMKVESLHPGVSLNDLQENTGFELLISDVVGETPVPTVQQLRLLREEIDPDGIYISRG